MRVSPLLAATLLLLAPLVGAHTFNHEDRHEYCQVYGDPNTHFIGDGHVHGHDDKNATTMALPDHDPCKQVRMAYPGFENRMPLSSIPPPAQEINVTDLLFSDGDRNTTEVFAGGEAYRFPMNDSLVKKRSGLAVLSDLEAAGKGFPGNGSYGNPYIVEGYIITGNMLFKDTAKCYVFRNNVVVSRAAVAPLIPDPNKIIELANITPYWDLVNRTAQDVRANYTNLSAHWDALKAEWDANLTLWDQDKAEADAALAALDAEATQWQAAFDAFDAAYLDMVGRTEGLADEFEWYASQYRTVSQPPRDHGQHIEDGEVADMPALQAAFEAYQQDLDDDLSNEDVEGWILANPPPEDPPTGWPHGPEMWELERENYDTIRGTILALIDEYWTELLPSAPDAAAHEAFLARYAQGQANHTAFMSTYDAFAAEYDGFMVGFDAFQDEFDAVWAETGQKIAAANAHFQKALDNVYEYAGSLGTVLFNTTTELAQWVLRVLFNILDIFDPNNAARNTGQMILDWNGQCIHAYNNVVADLRVNQNNDRTGYATGGAIEDNRFFDIGQIRHYDGIFRQNEVGNRAVLHSLANPSVVPLPASVQSVNNDGANQGWYIDNVFYGSTSLDFHGHHHAAGFFAPTSHYHGSTAHVAYMQSAAGACSATYASPNATRNGPWTDYPTDNDIHVLGQVVVERPDQQGCLPHFDHAKRWTSVYYTHNIFIDPNGAGLVFDDRNHRADDEWAPSENMLELKRPHFHQKWVQMENNTIVGQIVIDVLNAAGTDLWSDNWEKVLSPPGTPRIQEALAHPGAEVVNSHPLRNDAWLDIENNTLFLTKAYGVVLSDADDMELFKLRGNKAYAMPKSPTNLNMNASTMLNWLRVNATRDPDLVFAEIGSWVRDDWGGQDRGVQALAGLANLRDHYTVEHCDNAARGLDYGIIATDRIYRDIDPETQGVRACGDSDWGTVIEDVKLAYTTPPATPQRCTERVRDATDPTDDFYLSETAFDVLDGVVPASTCEALPLPAATASPSARTPSAAMLP